MEGYIRLHRKIIDNPIFRKPLVNHLFVYCLLRANHKKGEMVFNCRQGDVERGSFICGRKKFAEVLGESEQNVRSALRTLQQLGMLQISTTKSTSKYSYINVCNYNDYQFNGDEGNQETNLIATSKQPGSNQVATTNKNVLNILNDNTVKNPPKSPQGDREDFEIWWKYWKSLIWRHEGKKQKALEYYQKLKFTPEQITEATRKYLKSKKEANSYHQSAEGFLNPKEKQVKYYLEDQPPVKVETQKQNRTSAEPIVSPGTIHAFRYEIANCDADAAEKLWEKKEQYFRDHPILQKIFNNKLKERTTVQQ